MDLNEYIKMSYKRPNRKVLEGLGASEDLIEYLMETPGNTNWNVIESIGESGNDELSYTFHFRLTEIEIEGTVMNVSVCNEYNKWQELWSTFGNGNIPATLFNNIKINDTLTELEVEDIKKLSKIIISSDLPNNYEFHISNTEDESIVIMYYKGLFVSYYLTNYGENYNIEFDVTLSSKPGYIIDIDLSKEGYILEYYINPGESFTIDVSGLRVPLTDGKNNYQNGDTITPTSDMVLTPVISE